MQVSWDLWIDLYTETWCTGRNLAPKTIVAYRHVLRQFQAWVIDHHHAIEPTDLTTRIVLNYVTYLRKKRGNGDSAVMRSIVVLKNFFRAMIAFGHLEPRENPMAMFPAMRRSEEKLPTWLNEDETRRLLFAPGRETVLNLRDRAILWLLYATGIRASECATLREEHVDLTAQTVRVMGKGRRERVVSFNYRAAEAMKVYRKARGFAEPCEPFFLKKGGGGINRKIIYDRVKKYARKAKITKRVSPHTLRHTCATHLVQSDVNIVTIRDILGHRQLTSTQVYLHTTAHEMKQVMEDHPIARLAPSVESLIEGVRLPIDHPPKRPKHRTNMSKTAAATTSLQTNEPGRANRRAAGRSPGDGDAA